MVYKNQNQIQDQLNEQKMFVFISDLTKTLPCIESHMKEFRPVESYSKTSTQGFESRIRHRDHLDCLSCSESWEFWLNPFNWTERLWTTTRIVISILVLLTFLTIVAILVKCCYCIAHCCWCFFYLGSICNVLSCFHI